MAIKTKSTAAIATAAEAAEMTAEKAEKAKVEAPATAEATPETPPAAEATPETSPSTSQDFSLTVDDLAAATGFSVLKINALGRSGQITARIKSGRAYLYSTDAIEQATSAGSGAGAGAKRGPRAGSGKPAARKSTSTGAFGSLLDTLQGAERKVKLQVVDEILAILKDYRSKI